MLANGLAVQIDIHPEEPYKQAVKNDNEGVERFVMLWRFARHACPHTPFCTSEFCWMKSHRSEPLRTVTSAEVSEFC
jgi:hypothetical protein